MADERIKWETALKNSLDEAEGKTGERRTGRIFDEKQNAANSLKAEYKEYQNAQKIIIDSIKREQLLRIQEVDEKKAKGLLGQINALNKVASKNTDLFFSVWALRLFIICIELIPLILKGLLKQKDDSYVQICHYNNNLAIDLNKEKENNITLKEIRLSSVEDNYLLEQILKNKNIERAASDFKFYFNTMKYSSDYYEKTKNKIEKIVQDEELRVIMLNNLFEIFQDFITKTEHFYKSESEFENGPPL